MYWIACAVGAILVAVGLIAFPLPPSPVGLGTLAFGILLLLDCGFDRCIGYLSLSDERSSSDEIRADFYAFERAKWRYIVAFLVAAGIASASDLTGVMELQATALIGGFTLFGVFAFIEMFKSRRRVLADDTKL